jgi:hypothetical protein
MFGPLTEPGWARVPAARAITWTDVDEALQTVTAQPERPGGGRRRGARAAVGYVAAADRRPLNSRADSRAESPACPTRSTTIGRDIKMEIRQRPQESSEGSDRARPCRHSEIVGIMMPARPWCQPESRWYGCQCSGRAGPLAATGRPRPPAGRGRPRLARLSATGRQLQPAGGTRPRNRPRSRPAWDPGPGRLGSSESGSAIRPLRPSR